MKNFPFFISLHELSVIFISQLVEPGDIVLDCTVGNGHDTLFLAELLKGEGYVLGFDIQKLAIKRASKLLEKYKNVFLFLAGHEKMTEFLNPDFKARIKAAVFNLGYLPGSDRSIVTCGETTICCLKELEDWLAPGGGHFHSSLYRA